MMSRSSTSTSLFIPRRRCVAAAFLVWYTMKIFHLDDLVNVPVCAAIFRRPSCPWRTWSNFSEVLPALLDDFAFLERALRHLKRMTATTELKQ